MRITIAHLGLIAAAVTAACQTDRPELVAPNEGGTRTLVAASELRAPIVRITSPLAGETVASGLGRVGAGSLVDGSAFAINIETVTSDANVVAREGGNIRNTALLGENNPNFPGLTVRLDADLITPAGTIIPKNTNLANLFNVLGTDDTPGNGVTIWTGWHFLESFPDNVREVTITATVRDAAGRVGTDAVKIRVNQERRVAGQALTPAPTAVTGDGVNDLDGPEVVLIGPRSPSSLALGTPTTPPPGSLSFFQVLAIDRTGAGIGVNENGAGISQTVGLIADATQIALAGPNRNFPGLEFTFDVPLRGPNGIIIPAGRNLAPLFNIAGSAVDSQGRIRTTADWVVGGSLVLPSGKTSVTATVRVTDNAGKTGSVSRTFAISPVADGQALTPNQ